MIPYKTKTKKLAGTSYKEIWKKAQGVYSQIKRRTKRKPYIRSAYFNKQKIFFDLFWVHLAQKAHSTRVKRLKFFSCAIDLIRHSRNTPISKFNPHRKTEILHRFMGITKDKELFFVQIKEDMRTNRKHLMSIFRKE